MIAIFGRLIMLGRLIPLILMRRGATQLRRPFASRHHLVRVGFCRCPVDTVLRPPSMRNALCALLLCCFTASANAGVDPAILDAIKRVKPADYPSANTVSVLE